MMLVRKLEECAEIYSGSVEGCADVYASILLPVATTGIESFAVALSSAFGLGADRNYSEDDNVFDSDHVVQQWSTQHRIPIDHRQSHLFLSRSEIKP